MRNAWPNLMKFFGIGHINMQLIDTHARFRNINHHAESCWIRTQIRCLSNDDWDLRSTTSSVMYCNVHVYANSESQTPTNLLVMSEPPLSPHE